MQISPKYVKACEINLVNLFGNINNNINLKLNKMTARDYCFWLQGYFEVSDPVQIGKVETEMIKRHLNLVFKHEIDPSMGGPEHQLELNQTHSSFPSKDSDGVTLRC